MERICFIDFETTGVDYVHDHPVEIGAVLVNMPSFRVVKEFATLIRIPPGGKMSPTAQMIHGLDPKRLQKAPMASRVITKFFEVMGSNYSWGGWNLDFDLNFLRQMLRLSNYSVQQQAAKVNYRVMDVQSVAMAARHQGKIKAKSLRPLCEEFGIPMPEKHGALGDAKATAEVYRRLLAL